MIGTHATLDNGVTIFQATDELIDKSNIYCEFPWCPPSGRCFVYVRQAIGDAVNPSEFVMCQFGSWEKQVIGRGHAATIANGGLFYYQRRDERGQSEFIRVNLETGAATAIPLPAGIPAGARLDISPGERYIAYNQVLSYSPQLFAIGLADLQTGACEIIHTDPDICNTHHQFEPGEGKLLMVQHNRGCRFTPEGKLDLLVGPEGATLFMLEIPSGNVIRLQVGPPYTASISGHETWIGKTGEMLLTLNLQEDYDLGKGPIVGIRADSPAQTYCAPLQLNHIGIEPSGRVFCGDAFEPDTIYIGSTLTNRTTAVCPSQATYQRAKARGANFDSHPHAYISPDLKWVVYNSDVTGVQQIYCAAIPPEMIEGLLRTG